MRRAWLLAAALVSTAGFVPGCGQTAPTQLIVVVDTDYAIPGGIDEVDIDVMGPDGMHHLERQPMVSVADLPYTLTVVPRGSALGPIRIEATGLHAGTTVVSRVGRVSLVAQQTLMVRLDLLHACDMGSITCSGTEQTCGDGGRCVSIDVPTQPWTGTAPRIGEDTGVSLDAGVHDAGSPSDANLPDTNVDAYVPDTGVPVDAAGPDCHTLGCSDDGNGCTDEVCGTDGRCTHPNNSNGCDDGSFCNGTDLCGGGSCSVHSGDPCGGAACDETGRRCGSCATDADCPAPITGGFGPCGGFADACATSGTYSRTIQTFHCTTGSCVATSTTDTQGCTRPSTDGNNCGASSCGAYSRCSAATSDVCSTAGMQSRTCTDYACSGGTCNSVGRSDLASCSLPSQDGVTCMATTCGAWTGACDYTGDCHATGQMQSRSCTDYACGSGSCVAGALRTEMQPCPVAPNATVCTDNTIQCGVWHCDTAGVCRPFSGQCSGTQVCCDSFFPARCTTSSACLL